jgi:ubiquinone/menaquinone biosynthesis C-methylase UbiE
LAKPDTDSSRAICDYEGTSYRANFWDGHGREYEDLAERVALQHLLPPGGQRLLEVGAGFGRLADLYSGYEQVVLLDYAQSGLREAQERLGRSGRFLFVAADLYNLPLVPGACDTVVTVRVLHHVIDVPSALRSLAAVLRPDGTYVLEYANKRNLKAITRYILGRQRWSPFTEEPVEFAALNFDFHPQWMARELTRAGFCVVAGRSASYFRLPLFKRALAPASLAAIDGALQVPGAPLKFTPSVFLRCRLVTAPDLARSLPEPGGSEGMMPAASKVDGLFRCLECGGRRWQEAPDALICQGCGTVWDITDGVYDFKAPRHKKM